MRISDNVCLRDNANTSHESAEDWYEAYGRHVSTEHGGDVCVQAVEYDWLDDDDDEVVAEKLMEGMMYWTPCEDTEYVCPITEDEALSIVREARGVREAADTLEGLLDAAVSAYESGDFDATLAALRAASNHESDHGDDPATASLASQLLEESDE